MTESRFLFGIKLLSSAKSTTSFVHHKATQAVPCSTASDHLIQCHHHQPAQRFIHLAAAAEESSTKRVGQQGSIILAAEIGWEREIESSGVRHLLQDLQQRLRAGQAPPDPQRGEEVPLQPVQQGVQEAGPPQWPPPHAQGCFSTVFKIGLVPYAIDSESESCNWERGLKTFSIPLQDDEAFRLPDRGLR